MVTIKLMGGMGNQMFQYAMAKSLSIKNNIHFYMDRYYLDHEDWRNYDLDLFNIDENFIENPDRTNTIEEGWSDLTFREDIFNYDYQNKNTYLVGYFIHLNYIEPISDIIKKQFTLKNPILNQNTLSLLKEIKNSNSVMINVRRTDFVNNSFHGTMDLDYYNKGISIINNSVENTKFYIFSDDIEWCKENLNYIPNSFIVDHSYKGDRFGEYLELMKSCKHFIIPNSTFAWWSAYLSDNKDKIVVAPKNWHLSSQLKMDVITEKLNWIKI